MAILHDHLFALGILADSLTFAGAVIFAWDAFFRLGGLNDLKRKRIDDEFRRMFPKLNLTDKDWEEAIRSVKRALAGAVLLLVGFFLQILLRIAERQ